jgi:hypothetical protein
MEWGESACEFHVKNTKRLNIYRKSGDFMRS